MTHDKTNCFLCGDRQPSDNRRRRHHHLYKKIALKEKKMDGTQFFMVISRSGDRDGLREALADSMYQAKLDLSARVIRLVSKDIMRDNQPRPCGY